ncbi:MAG: DUF4124 domain-containing protein, partial [Methylosarcina sp.]
SCFMGLLLSQPAYAKKMYRWIDENGKTHLSDQVPPEHAQYRRESLSNKGRVIDVTEKAKTKEQLALDARLEKLKKAQEKIIAKQKSQDKVLLSTYRNINDMNLAINTKMLALGLEGKVLQNNLNQRQSELERLLKRAAGYERNGEKTPPLLVDQIQSAKSQIEVIKKDLDRQTEKQKNARAEFEADIKRYQYLTQSDVKEAQKLSDQSSEMLAADALGLYQCRDDADCSEAWRMARQFVAKHSTTATDIDSENLIMTREPAKDDDLSLSISKIALEKKKPQIFLDIRCRSSSLGDELCNGQKVADIRSAFRSFIESQLKAIPN